MNAQPTGHEETGPTPRHSIEQASMVQDAAGALGPGAFAAPLRSEPVGPSRIDLRPAAWTMNAPLNDSLLDVLGTMRMGAAIVAIDGQVAYLNEAGKEAIAGDIGLALRGDRLVATSTDGRRKLALALAVACRPPFVDGAVLLGPGRASSVTRPLRVMSMERIAGRARCSDAGHALLCVGSGRQRPPDASMLAQLFGLTAAEASLMAGIAGGERLHQCAERRGVSLATVRAQLRNVFVKTGAATQADLTFIAWSIPGLWIN